MNRKGHPETLVASHPGNRKAQRSGAFSRRDAATDPAVREIADAMMAAPHTEGIDEIGAVEIAKPVVLLDAIDAETVDFVPPGAEKPYSEARFGPGRRWCSQATATLSNGCDAFNFRARRRACTRPE